VRSLKIAGFVMMMLAAAAFGMMTMIMAGLTGFVGAGLLILIGLGLMTGTLFRGRLATPAEKQPLSAAGDVALSTGDIVADVPVKEKIHEMA
jgi:hypothetical protein